jgi:hypothetical protein
MCAAAAAAAAAREEKLSCIDWPSEKLCRP